MNFEEFYGVIRLNINVIKNDMKFFLQLNVENYSTVVIEEYIEMVLEYVREELI